MNDPAKRSIFHWLKQKETWRLAFAVLVVIYLLYGYFFSWSSFSQTTYNSCSSENPGRCRSMAYSIIAETDIINKEALGYLKIACKEGDDSESCAEIARTALSQQISAAEIEEATTMIYAQCSSGKVHLCPYIPKLSNDPKLLRGSLAAIESGCGKEPEFCIFKVDYYANANDQRNFLKQEKLACEDFPQYCDSFIEKVYRSSKLEIAKRILSKYCSSQHQVSQVACRLSKNLQYRK